MSNSTTDHIKTIDLEAIHNQSKSAPYNDARCLRRHGHWAKNSCSYKYQAYYRVQENDKSLRHLYEIKHNTGKGEGKFLIVNENSPNGENTDWSDSFFFANENSKHPWPHNAHHLIPISSLINAITTATAPSPALAQYFKGKLMEENYSINHWSNMISLPSNYKVAKELALPAHVGGHSKYDEETKERIQSIIDNAMKPSTMSCDKIEAKMQDVAKSIRKLQRKLLEMIGSWKMKENLGNRSNKNIHINRMSNSITKL